jgi:hypothetical protein
MNGWAEQTIYKCEKPDGSVIFSAAPCGTNAKVVDTSSALKSGTSPNVQGVSDRAAMGVIDGECRGRERGIWDESNVELARIEKEVQFLRADMNRSANNYAGATRDNGIRGQIDGATQRRQDVIARRDADLNALAKDCDQRRAAEQRRESDRDGSAASNP